MLIVILVTIESFVQVSLSATKHHTIFLNCKKQVTNLILSNQPIPAARRKWSSFLCSVAEQKKRERKADELPKKLD
jgi:hypothetical protein